MQTYAMVASSSDDVDAPASSQHGVALGGPSPVAHLNPLLRIRRLEDDPIFIDDVSNTEKSSACAILDKRILESNARPHMYLTDPPCTCVHIDVEYGGTTVRHCQVLRVRRSVYDPAGVTFGAIHKAPHEKGLVAVYERDKFVWFRYESIIEQHTTLRKQIQNLEQEGGHVSLAEEISTIEFCHFCIPSEADFEDISRSGRVKGFSVVPE